MRLHPGPGQSCSIIANVLHRLVSANKLLMWETVELFIDRYASINDWKEMLWVVQFGMRKRSCVISHKRIEILMGHQENRTRCLKISNVG